MTGRVVGHQARLGVAFRLRGQPDLEIQFVINTGFEGTLTLPESAVLAMQLPFYQRIRGNLADDGACMVAVHKATILWGGQEAEVAVLAMGQRPLLGTMLLDGHNLTIPFVDGGVLSLVPLQSDWPQCMSLLAMLLREPNRACGAVRRYSGGFAAAASRAAWAWRASSCSSS